MQMTRRDILGYFAIALAFVAGVGLFWYVNFVPYTLRIAVAPSQSEPAHFFVALKSLLERERAGVRLIVVPLETPEEASKAIEANRVDLAVVRSDQPLPRGTQGVAISHPLVALAMVRPNIGVTSFSDLRGKAVGLLGRGQANLDLFHALMDLNNLPRDSVRLVILNSSTDIAPVVANGEIDAVFFAGPRGGRGPGAVINAFRDAVKEPPTLLTLGALSSLLGRNPALSETEVLAGEFSNTPPLPAKDMKTLSFPSLIISRRQVSDAAIKEFTKQLFTLRLTLGSQFPAAGRISVLSTERKAPFPVHPGAAKYYDGTDDSFLTQHSDILWLLLFGFSTIASLAAWLWSLALPKKKLLVRAEREELVALIAKCRNLNSISDIESIEREVDRLLVAISDHLSDGTIESDQQASFDMLIARIGTILESKREKLQRLV